MVRDGHKTLREGTELQTKFEMVHVSNKNEYRGSGCGSSVMSGCGGGVRSGGCVIEDLTSMMREVGGDNMYG